MSSPLYRGTTRRCKWKTLLRGRSRGADEVYAVGRCGLADGAPDPNDSAHEVRAHIGAVRSDVGNVLARDDESVPWARGV